MKTLVLLLLLVMTACTPMINVPSRATPTPEPTKIATATSMQTPTKIASATPQFCIVVTPNDEVLNVRKGPSLESEIVAGVFAKTRFTVTGRTNDWLKVTGPFDGYVFEKFCKGE